jgi:hypothetical protein
VQESLDYFRQAEEAIGHASQAGSWFVISSLYPTVQQALRWADIGDLTKAGASFAAASRSVEELQHSEPSGSSIPVLSKCLLRLAEARLAIRRGDPATARRVGKEGARLAGAAKATSGNEEFLKNVCSFGAGDQAGQAEYMLGDYAAAEQTARETLTARQLWPVQTDTERRQVTAPSIVLAMSLARQGRSVEARQVIDPVIKFHRELAARNHGDEWQHVELASALYAQALSDKSRAPALLKEAAQLVQGVPVEMRSLLTVRIWRDRIDEALRKPAVLSLQMAPRVGSHQ